MLVAGIPLGAGTQVVADVQALIELIKNPVAAYDAVKALATDPEVRRQLGAAVLADVDAKLAVFKRALEDGGLRNSVAAGEVIGSVAITLAGAATGAYGAAKAATKVATIGVKLTGRATAAANDAYHALKGAFTVPTPYGTALQSIRPAAIAARAKVLEGATLYRIGTMGRSNASEAQFWSLENPATPGYAGRHGIPPANVANADFIETATLKPGTVFITRVAPPVGSNRGGGIEIVLPANGVVMKMFRVK